MTGTINLVGPSTVPLAPVLTAGAINTAVNAALAGLAPLASPPFSGAVMIGSGGTALAGASLQATGASATTQQLEVQNLATGATASTDLVATADDGTDTTNFIDLGINSSGNTDATFTIAAAHDGYLYAASGGLAIGTATAAKSIALFTGGTMAANLRATVSDTGVALAVPLTPTQTGGIVGTTTNNDAQAGSVGEFVTATVAVGSAVALTTATPANVTSISLTAGDWDVRGTVAFTPAATTSITSMLGGIGTVTAALPAVTSGAYFAQFMAAFVPGVVNPTYAAGTTRLTLAATTTVYLVAQAAFTVAALGAFGFIGARRVR